MFQARINIFIRLALGFALVASPVFADDEHSEHTGATGGSIELTEEGKSAIGLQVETVAKHAVPRRINTSGRIEAIPTQEYTQHSQTAGRVSHVFVRLGDYVKAGETLLSLSSPDLQQIGAQIVSEKTSIEAEIKMRTAELDGEVSQTKTQKDLAEANFKRDTLLFHEKITSRKQMESTKAEYELAENKLKVARQTRDASLAALRSKLGVSVQALRQRLTQLGLTASDIDRMLAHKTSMTDVPVRTARAGLITELSATPGQSVDTTVSLAKVSDLSKLWAAAHVYESDMGRVSIGQPISVKVSALPQETFSGKLTFISSSVDPVSRVLPVKVEVTNNGNKLHPGMFAELTIQTAEPFFAVTLPRDAVISDKGHYIVYVEVDGKYVPTPVQIGNSYGDKIEILSGVSAGQNVVTRGAFQLDAQRLKSIGDTALFSHPTEEGHDEHEHEEHGANEANAGFNPQFAILIAIAFVLGGALTSLWQRRRMNVGTRESTTRRPDLSEKGS